VLANGSGENAHPLQGVRGVLIWAPLRTSPSAIAAHATVVMASGVVASPLAFLEQAEGPLRTFRLLEAGAPAACCRSSWLVELTTEKLVFRGVVHQPGPRVPEDLLQLRPAYSAREASAWAVCEWNSRPLDPVEVAGILLVDEFLTKGGSPALYVLWQDVDGVPRAWEDLGEVADPRVLTAAFGAHFRYVARDEDLLVVDQSPITPLGRNGTLTEELVFTKPYARPPLLEITSH
jgi:hypothetical protein